MMQPTHDAMQPQIIPPSNPCSSQFICGKKLILSRTVRKPTLVTNERTLHIGNREFGHR